MKRIELSQNWQFHMEGKAEKKTIDLPHDYSMQHTQGCIGGCFTVLVQLHRAALRASCP